MPHKCKITYGLAIIAYSNCRDFSNLLACHGQQKTKQTRYIKIKVLRSTNRDHKKAFKQDIRYYSIDSNGQDNIQLSL